MRHLRGESFNPKPDHRLFALRIHYYLSCQTGQLKAILLVWTGQLKLFKPRVTQMHRNSLQWVVKHKCLSSSRPCVQLLFVESGAEVELSVRSAGQGPQFCLHRHLHTGTQPLTFYSRAEQRSVEISLSHFLSCKL